MTTRGAALCLAAITAMVVWAGCDDDGADATDDMGMGQPDAAPGAADAAPPADADTRDILDRLRDLPGVVSVEERETDLADQGYRFFYIQFRQPVDHADPDGASFEQFLSLHHRHEDAPFVLQTSGYANGGGDRRSEPARLLSANHLAVEHRYFAGSRPDPADWSFLTVEQSAADFHAIAESFHGIYTGKWIGTGASKGGMTSVYHRRFYPDDLDGTIAYVAPHMTSTADPRFDAFLTDVVPNECDEALRAAQVDWLTNRRDMLEERTTAEAANQNLGYTKISIPAAVESAVLEAEFAYWQYVGLVFCDEIPTAASTDDEVWDFISAVSPPANLNDGDIEYFAPYYHQAYAELGYPAVGATHLAGLLLYGDEDYLGIFPTGAQPSYDGSTMAGVGAWVKAEAEDIIFVYGQYDPWTAGAFDLGENPNVQAFTVANGTHGASLSRLSAADRAAAFATIEAWTGVTPMLPMMKPGQKVVDEDAPMPRMRRGR